METSELTKIGVHEVGPGRDPFEARTRRGQVKLWFGRSSSDPNVPNRNWSGIQDGRKRTT